MINYPTDAWIERCKSKAKSDDIVYRAKRAKQGWGFWLRSYQLEQAGQRVETPKNNP